MQDDKSKVVPIVRRVPKKPVRDISDEPEMIELDRMICEGELDRTRTLDYLKKIKNVQKAGGKGAGVTTRTV